MRLHFVKANMDGQDEQDCSGTIAFTAFSSTMTLNAQPMTIHATSPN
jgi:hypothetical protein